MIEDTWASARRFFILPRHRIHRSHDRWSPGNVGHSQPTVPSLGPGAAITRRLGRQQRGQLSDRGLIYLEARAQFDAPERAVNMSVAEHAGRIYLDLADEHWRVVAISADGWKVVGCPLPKCCHFPYRNAADRSKLAIVPQSCQRERLCIAWLLSGGAVPIRCWRYLASRAPQKQFCPSSLEHSDPNAATVGSLPREERELMIAANNGHLLAFDNLSGLPGWLSDALYRLASAGSFALRRLYTMMTLLTHNFSI
jgi:hypothetical protein